MKEVRTLQSQMLRELRYLSLSVLFGVLVLPAIFVVLVNIAAALRIVTVPVFPSIKEIPILYGVIFSALIGAKEERPFLPMVIGFYCFFPYAVFQIIRFMKGLFFARRKRTAS